MEAIGKEKNTWFMNILKRIWDGPDYANPGRVSSMQFAGGKMIEFNQNEQVSDFKIEVKADEPEPKPEPEYSVPRLAEPPKPDFQPIKPDFHSQKAFDIPAENDFGSQKQMTIISKGTIITGDLKSEGDIEVYGTLTGSVSTVGNIRISGRQVGDVQGANITLSSCTVRGNITAAEDVKIDSDSVVIGDVKAKNLDVNGKLQGNVHGKSSITCQNNAVIVGDLTAASIVVNNGARLQGKMQVFNGQLGEIKIPEEEKGTHLSE